MGDFSFEGLELLDEHVVEGIKVFGELSSSCSTTHPLKRQILLFFVPLLLVHF
jgi:hypothetical protein